MMIGTVLIALPVPLRNSFFPALPWQELRNRARGSCSARELPSAGPCRFDEQGSLILLFRSDPFFLSRSPVPSFF